MTERSAPPPSDRLTALPPYRLTYYVEPMIRRCTRAQAALLLAVFLAAGSSLPSVDALFFHSGADELQGSRPHVEAAGGCVNHSGSCTLGRTAPGSAAVILAKTQPQVILPSPPPPRAFVTQHQSESHPTTQARPRAPPASVS
jgi:hypothetical protein